jgi:alkaline phosphatase D
MLYRYTHARSQPELQPLLASTAHYAIWDDHDYGPNDSDGTFVHKSMARDVFEAFWGNPTYGLDGRNGITTFFQYADVEFFLLDDRYFRTANNCETCPGRTMLGKEQLDWLKQALAASYAPFKVVACGGQVLTTNKGQETYINLFPAERDSILAHIERENIKGVVFLTGDRHFSELSAMQNSRGNWVYDLTVSPLSAGPYNTAAETVNEYRVPGTLVGQRNFAIINVSGARKSRELKIDVYDSNGQALWTRTIGPDGSLK